MLNSINNVNKLGFGVSISCENDSQFKKVQQYARKERVDCELVTSGVVGSDIFAILDKAGPNGEGCDDATRYNESYKKYKNACIDEGGNSAAASDAFIKREELREEFFKRAIPYDKCILAGKDKLILGESICYIA